MCMKRGMTVVAVTIAAVLANSMDLHAQGKGTGLNRGLAAAAKGSSSSGLAKAMGKSASASNGVLRSGSGFGRTSSGPQNTSALPPSSPTVSVPDSADGGSVAMQASDNPQRILDHRLQEADHLRAVSTANGNQHLLDTADLMQANATTNYQRQEQRLNQTTPNSSPDSSTTPSPTSVTSDASNTTSAGATHARARRGFWFRSR
jgi:hypothetical protein